MPRINSNVEAAINIVEGHGSATQISSAAENISNGDVIRALGDIVGALDALGEMAGRGIPYAKGA